MQLRVTKLFRPETDTVKVDRPNMVGSLNGMRTKDIEGSGDWPVIGQSILVCGESLTPGLGTRLFETSTIVKIEGDVFHTRTGSRYRVQEIK